MARYIFKDGRFVDPQTGSPMLSDDDRAKPVAMPMIISDIPEYRSPIDGRLITSRSERRDDLKRNNCVDARDFPSPTGGKIRNKAFAKKHGLKVSEEFL